MISATASNKKNLRVGSWPGWSSKGNPFIKIFCDSLTIAGAEVIDVKDPIILQSSSIDILHIHWPEDIFWKGGSFVKIVARLFRTLRAIFRLKRNGVKIVWMVHNLQPHDLRRKFRLLWPFYKYGLSYLADGFITLSPSTLELVRSNYPLMKNKPSVFSWLPSYPHSSLQNSRREIRENLGFSASTRLFVFIGMVRPYKGVDQLIDTFRELQGDQFGLLIAGESIDAAYRESISRAAEKDARIKIVLRRLSDEEHVSYMEAADAIILPFRNYLHSSSMIHALSQGRALITPKTPFAEDISREVGPGWIQLYDPPLCQDILLSWISPEGAPILKEFSPEAFSRVIIEFYKELQSRV